ncbi:MAG TPA: hypothetical protein VGD54_21380 [Steroidobacteraceae bacterium]
MFRITLVAGLASVLKHLEPSKLNWCIIEADDHRSDRALNPAGNPAPMQYCPLAEGATPLQRSLHRAAAIALTSQVIITAFEEFRHLWQPLLWGVRPERRFICDNREAVQLASAAAILSVAAHSPSNIITILPARCSVIHEWILKRAIHRAIADLPAVPEGAITLGMADLEEGVDEDYLVVSPPRVGRGFRVDGFARRPIPWVARHLRQGGALVASGIMIGYAGVFAAHISKNWPGITKKLAQVILSAAAIGEECEIASALNRGVPPGVLHALRWYPPAFPQRVFSVFSSGWSGLKSPRSIARRLEFLASSENALTEATVRRSPMPANRSMHEAPYHRTGDLREIF